MFRPSRDRKGGGPLPGLEGPTLRGRCRSRALRHGLLAALAGVGGNRRAGGGAGAAVPAGWRLTSGTGAGSGTRRGGWRGRFCCWWGRAAETTATPRRRVGALAHARPRACDPARALRIARPHRRPNHVRPTFRLLGAHDYDMSGFVAHNLSGSEPSPRRLNEPDGDAARGTDEEVRGGLRPVAAKTDHASACSERSGRDGPDVPALGGSVRGGRPRSPEGQAGGGTGSSPGASRGGGGAGGAVPGRDGYGGWNVRHFHEEVYVREHGGSRSYTWVKNRLQEAGLVKKGRRKGPRTGSGGSGSRLRG